MKDKKNQSISRMQRIAVPNIFDYLILDEKKEKKLKEVKRKANAINITDDLFIVPSNGTIREITNMLPRAFYEVIITESLASKNVSLRISDIKVPTSSITIVNEFLDKDFLMKFFSKRSTVMHRELNVFQKYGFLFHGKQGSGKTTLMFAISKWLMENFYACSFVVDGVDSLKETINIVKKMRNDLGHNFMAVFIWDECEEGMKSSESYVKKVLDGKDSVSNSVFLAATNYFDKIPETISGRKSRFQEVIQIDGIDHADVCYSILKGMNDSISDGMNEKKIKELTTKCVGGTVDDIKTAFVNEYISES